MLILEEGFESVVRSRFGIDADDLPDEELNQKLVLDLAEATIIKRVPEYTRISNPIDLLYLQNAVIAQICIIVCPSMPKRLNLKLAISDVKLEKEKVDWLSMISLFSAEIEANLEKIESVPVITDVLEGNILVDKIRNKRDPIGGGRQW